MNPDNKRTENARKRTLEKIRQHPGIKASELSLAERRALRWLEDNNLIWYQNTTGTWFPTFPTPGD